MSVSVLVPVPVPEVVWKGWGVSKDRLWDKGGSGSERRTKSQRYVVLTYCLCMYIFAFSNRCSKDSSCAHKGLVTNWPHHCRPTSLKFGNDIRSQKTRIRDDPETLPPVKTEEGQGTATRGHARGRGRRVAAAIDPAVDMIPISAVLLWK